MKNLSIIILAAGKGKRMGSSLPKVLNTLCGRTLIGYVIDAANKLHPCKVVVVVGHKAELVMGKFKDSCVEFVLQNHQLGTGHAAAQCEPNLNGIQDDIIILSGDVPLIKYRTLLRLYDEHINKKFAISLLSTKLDNPTGYGHVIRGLSGSVEAIIEDRDASPEVRAIKEINSGIYCVKSEFLFKALKGIDNNNDQNEYYLTDIVKEACGLGLPVGAVTVEDKYEVMGINTVQELQEMEKKIKCQDL